VSELCVTDVMCCDDCYYYYVTADGTLGLCCDFVYVSAFVFLFIFLVMTGVIYHMLCLTAMLVHSTYSTFMTACI
jgi:hypothetical protein